MNHAHEHELVRRAKSGDPDAVEALIRAHQGALYAFMLRMSGREDVAEDIVQEALVRVLKNLERFDTRFRFSTWLFTIAKRLYVNSIQKLGPSYDSDAVEVRPGAAVNPSGASARLESLAYLRGLVETLMAGLSEQQREVILLFHQQDWSISEIAEHLRMPQGTVKSHLHRGRQRMKRLIVSNRTMHRRVEEVFA
jgi:RNA polymerase sigma-70 factor (ECF subfamily)